MTLKSKAQQRAIALQKEANAQTTSDCVAGMVSKPITESRSPLTIEDIDRMLNCLAFFSVVAWRLMICHMRGWRRTNRIFAVATLRRR